MHLTKSKIFLIFIISFVVGIFFSNFYILNYQFYFFITLFLLFIVSLILRNKIFLVFLLGMLSIFCGFYYFNYFFTRIIPQSMPYDKIISFDGVIYTYPDERQSITKYTVNVTRCDLKEVIGKNILVDLPKYPQYKFNDTITLTGKLEKPTNFDEFDYEMYLARYQIFALIKYNQFDDNAISVSKISSNNKPNISSLIFELRSRIYTNFKKIFAEPNSGIMSAIILGLKRAIPDDFMEKLRLIGLSHIVVISGFHVAVMIKIFQSITSSWSKKLSFLIGTLFLISFVILTGGAPSVIRASIMAWLFLLAPILGRRGKITNILALTIFLMIIENPLILVYDVSFQLSVLAVLGLIYIMPLFDRFFSRFGKIIGSAISATLSAQIMTLPIILASFGRISVVAPITNIMITPFLSIIIPYGLIVAVISLITIKFAFIISWPLSILLGYIVSITNFFSDLRFASISLSTSNWFMVIYFFVLIIILYLFNIYESRSNTKK